MTQAKFRILTAMALYRVAHGVVGEDLIEVAEPTDREWHEWIAKADVDGNPETACVAVHVCGFAVFFDSVEEALRCLPARYDDASLYQPRVGDNWN